MQLALSKKWDFLESYSLGNLLFPLSNVSHCLETSPSINRSRKMSIFFGSCARGTSTSTRPERPCASLWLGASSTRWTTSSTPGTPPRSCRTTTRAVGTITIKVARSLASGPRLRQAGPLGVLSLPLPAWTSGRLLYCRCLGGAPPSREGGPEAAASWPLAPSTRQLAPLRSLIRWSLFHLF